MNYGSSRRWRDVVQSSLGVCQRLKRNVLQINLDKEEIGEVVDEDAIAKLFAKIGIKKQQVEGVQFVPPKSPRNLFVWFDRVDLQLYKYPSVQTFCIQINFIEN